MLSIWNRFLRDDHGATAMEYALLASLMAIVAIGALQALGSAMSEKWDTISTSMDDAVNGGS